MTGALQPRERRLLVLAVVVGVGVLGYVYAVEPLLARQREVRELITAREDLLSRQQRLLQREQRYAEELRTLRAGIAERRGRLLPGDKAPLAASELQKLVKSTAEETGVEVRSERVLPVTERGGYTEVPIEVTLAGPIRALTAFVHRLEGTAVLVSLKNLQVRVVSIGAPKELSATLSLTGYIGTGATVSGGVAPGGPTAGSGGAGASGVVEGARRGRTDPSPAGG